MGTAVLFITHGLAAERRAAGRYAPSHCGAGPALEILQHPQHLHQASGFRGSRSLASACRVRTRTRHHAHGRRFTGSAKNASSSDSRRAPHQEFPSAVRREMPRLLMIDDVSFTLRRGKTLAVVGESGSGKSTAANDPPPGPTSGQGLLRR